MNWRICLYMAAFKAMKVPNCQFNYNNINFYGHWHSFTFIIEESNINAVTGGALTKRLCKFRCVRCHEWHVVSISGE